MAYRFTGQEIACPAILFRGNFDVNLHNFRARNYDSDIGMFYATDPAGENFARYSYVGGNPVSNTDPTGMIYIPRRIDDDDRPRYNRIDLSNPSIVDPWDASSTADLQYSSDDLAIGSDYRPNYVTETSFPYLHRTGTNPDTLSNPAWFDMSTSAPPFQIGPSNSYGSNGYEGNNYRGKWDYKGGNFQIRHIDFSLGFLGSGVDGARYSIQRYGGSRIPYTTLKGATSSISTVKVVGFLKNFSKRILPTAIVTNTAMVYTGEQSLEKGISNVVIAYGASALGWRGWILGTTYMLLDVAGTFDKPPYAPYKRSLQTTLCASRCFTYKNENSETIMRNL